MLPLTFAPLRTPRLQVDLEELAGADAIYLCQLPSHRVERGTTELLQRIVVTTAEPRRGQVIDQRLWSVQERAFVVAHYLAGLLQGDFKIGENGKYSDYLIEGGIGDPPPAVNIGEVDGEAWFMQPLLGWHAEAIERLVIAEELTSNRPGWLVGAMAAQLYSVSEGPLECYDQTDAVIDQAMVEKATKILKKKEGVFMTLVGLYYQHLRELDHTFILSIGDDGFCFLPASGVPDLPPARFHFSMAVRDDTAAIFGPSE